MAGLQQTISVTALPDSPGDSSTYWTGGTDRLDITASGNDVRLEFIVGNLPQSPIRCRAGLHRSIPGLSLAYPPHGIEGFRLSNWTPGSVAAADVEAYGT